MPNFPSHITRTRGRNLRALRAVNPIDLSGLALQTSIAVSAQRLTGGAQPAAPVQSALATATTGGTLAAGPYYYVVTVRTAGGVSVVSNEQTITTTGATSTVTVSWAAVSGALSYQVWRATAAGQQVACYDVGNVLTYLDTNVGIGAAATSLFDRMVKPVVHSTIAALDLPLQSGRMFPTAALATTAGFTSASGLNTRGVHLTIASTEQAVYIVGEGQYANGSYRKLHIEWDSSALDMNTLRTGTVTFDASARVPADRGSRVHTTFNVGTTAQPRMPIEWLLDPGKAGRAPCIGWASDPNYTSKCGAYELLLTKAEQEGLTTPVTLGDGTATTHGAIATQNNTWFDSLMMGAPHYGQWVGKSISDGVSGGRSNPAGGVTAVTAWSSGNEPYAYYDYINTLGALTGQYATQQAFYDRAQAFFVKYLETGDYPTYGAKACAQAYFYYLWIAKARSYDTGAPAGTFAIYGAPNGAMEEFQSSESFGAYALLGGQSEVRLAVAAMATGRHADVNIGQSSLTLTPSNSIGGDPRINGHIGQHRRLAWQTGRPFGEAGSDEPSSGYWLADIDDYVDKVTLPGSTAFDNTASPAGHSPAPGWSGYWQEAWDQFITDKTTVGRIGYNTFKQPIQGHALIGIYDNCPISTARKSRILNTLQANWNFMYPGEWEGEPTLNTTTVTTVPNRIGEPSLRMGFSGIGCIDPPTYTVNTMSAMATFPAYAAWLAARTRSAEMAAIADRMLASARGRSTALDGCFGPYIGVNDSASGAKPANEYWYLMHRFWRFRKFAPTAGAIASDVITQITLSAASLSGTVGGSGSLVAQPRTAQRQALKLVVTASSNNTAVATVGTIVASGLGYSVPITYVGGGTATITVLEPVSGVTKTFVVTATAAQLSESWASINAGIWTTTLTGAGTAAVATGQLSLKANGTGAATEQLVSVASYSLDTSGVLGVQAKLVSHTANFGVGDDFVLVDASNNGFGIRLTGATGMLAVTIAAGVFTGQSSVVYTPNNYYRIVKNGTAINIDTSTDGTTWSALATMVGAATGVTTTAMKVKLRSDNTGAGADQTFVVGALVVN